MPRLNRCQLLKNIGWEAYYGTTATGQLSRYLVDDNICSINMDLITMPGVTRAHFHKYHIKCPYSVEAESHFVRDDNQFSQTYGQLVEVTTLNTHLATGGVMIRWNRGAKYGWLCPDDGCYYFNAVTSGGRYFYV